MSSTTVVNSQSNFLIGVTDVSKIFLGQNQTENDTYVNNTSYDPITLYAGTVLGRVATTNVLVPSISTASDGSQYVMGILGQDLVIAAGGTIKALVFVSGRVAQDKVILWKSTDTLTTIVGGRTYHDKIQGETTGIKLVQTYENTYPDNY